MTTSEHRTEGIGEDLKGKAKEVIGKVTDNDNLEREGRAQQRKADAARDADSHQAAADAARGREAAQEAEQRTQQTR